MKNMKKLAVLLLTAALSLSLAACGQTPPAPGSSGPSQPAVPAADGPFAGRNISVMTPYLSSVTTNQMCGYLEESLKAQGAAVTVIDTANDFAALAGRIEDVVAAKTDAIVLVSADPTQLKNQLQDAFDAGIPVFGCDSGFIDGMQVNATSDNHQMGQLIVNYLFNDLMGGEGSVIAMTHRPHPGVVKRCEAFDELLGANEKITLITEQHVPAEQPINDAQDIMQNLLLANPDEGSITAVFCAWDEPAIGSTQACQEAGRDEILIVGVDGNQQAVSLIQAGSNLKATVAQNFQGMTDIVVEQMGRLFAGEAIQPGEMYAEATLITADNAADFVN